jgi:hypothetical protein
MGLFSGPFYLAVRDARPNPPVSTIRKAPSNATVGNCPSGRLGRMVCMMKYASEII